MGNSRLSRISIAFLAIAGALTPSAAWTAGGTFTLSLVEEADDQPIISRIRIRRLDAPGKRIPIRLTVPAGMGVVLDRRLELRLPETSYSFRVIRGPEYRIVSGNFTLERTSLDAKTVELPRMIDMRAHGWISGDCFVPSSPYSLPLRMAAEDLHVAAVAGHVDPKPIPRRSFDEPIEHDPIWIREDAKHHAGIVVYGDVDSLDKRNLPTQWIASIQNDADSHIAIENPFAWALPVWLASEHVDGMFVLGDWLRLDRKISRPPDGRGPTGPSIGDDGELGRWALHIYTNVLEAGFRIPPLAGSGDQSGNTPIGYNRLYVAASSDEYAQSATTVQAPEQWWNAAWAGQSVATNGPMLRPKLDGKPPGHVFRAAAGEKIVLQPELNLAVRDRVDYLEVIQNGIVRHTARLDEFAKAGGRLPPLTIDESSWVMIRVVTLYEDHLRAAVSAPWYVDIGERRRIHPEAVAFFRNWLAEYEQRLRQQSPREIERHAPFIRHARRFWRQRLP